MKTIRGLVSAAIGVLAVIFAAAPAAADGRSIVPATLKIGPSPVGPEFKRYVVECKHWETRGDVIVPEGNPLTESQLAKVVVASFQNASRCNCAADLWRKYGAIELPNTLLVTPGVGASRN